MSGAGSRSWRTSPRARTARRRPTTSSMAGTGSMPRLRRQVAQPFRTPLIAFLPTYGAVSHRWLTRPLVAFPASWRPTRSRGTCRTSSRSETQRAARTCSTSTATRLRCPGEACDLRSAYYTSLVVDLNAAGDAFERASECGRRRRRRPVWRTQRRGGASSSPVSGRRSATGSRSAPCVARGVEGTVHRRGPARASPTPRRIEGTCSRSCGTSSTTRSALPTCSPAIAGRVIARAADAADEDTFTLGPDLAGQLIRKREVMLAHWQDVARLVPRAAA